MSTTAAVVRNSKGLVDTLFDSIDKLNRREIDSEHARAISHTARAIVSIAALEIDFRRFNRDGHAEIDGLKSLVIEGATKGE